MEAWYALRSIVFIFLQIIITLLFSFTGVLLSPFMNPLKNNCYFVIGNRLIIRLLKPCCGVSVEIEGQLPTPPTPYVILSNHQSQWETFFLQWYLRPAATVLKKELLSIPFFGTALKTMQAIGIDRNNPRAAMRQTMEQGLDRLEKGYNLLIYPEGTRIPPGKLGTFARGGAGIAVKAGVAIIPLAHNAGRCWPPKGHIIRPGKITVVVGEPIPTEGRDPKELTREVVEWIDKQCQRIG